jgi:hypothetical protein
MRVLLTMLICCFAASCGTVPGPSPDMGVQISRACEDLAQAVDGPEWRKGVNAKALLADTTVALDVANENLAATRDCQANQRVTYAPASDKER